MCARRGLLALGLGLLLAACQQRITPPRSIADAVTVYVTDHGRHAGLVLPAGEGKATEWFWGDWHYFALRERSLGSGLRALFGSPAATLGRFDIADAGSGGLAARTGARKVLGLRVDRTAAEALHRELSARYARRRDSEVVHPDGSRFVRDGGGYGIFYNSNHKVCEWLETLGADTCCAAITARFVVVPG